ncbi:LysR family transcriptional regulator [Bifidobacterium xylocopae]|uniref:HTH lysR-type domain-containing protein n=1 Tax=Bifidobacterium xylocopae TaxID=2493119 RepID=A0A366KBP7_9BIFI|nr:LysR family transcriptional regulator [Bifidobacterium xylocopae]RBP99155.1 hypothetical protein CRD59_05180 [Bifidobacterium xylocopae]
MTQVENIRDLKLLVDLSHNHSFTETAYQAHLSQPTVSMAIKRLERQLGKPLVARQRFGAGGVQLTPAGLVAVRHAEQILAELDSLGAAVATTGRTLTRRIGLPPIISSLLNRDSHESRLPLAGLSGSLSLCTVGSGRLLEQMRRHQVDYGAVASVQDELAIPEVQIRRVITYPFGLAGSASAIRQLGDGPGQGLHVADLIRLPESTRFVTLNHEFIHADASDALLRRYIPASRIIEVADVETLKAITQAGVAFSFITSAGIEDGDGLTFLPFTDSQAPKFNIYLFHDQRRTSSPDVKADLRAFTAYADTQLATVRA